MNLFYYASLQAIKYHYDAGADSTEALIQLVMGDNKRTFAEAEADFIPILQKAIHANMLGDRKGLCLCIMSNDAKARDEDSYETISIMMGTLFKHRLSDEKLSGIIAHRLRELSR